MIIILSSALKELKLYNKKGIEFFSLYSLAGL